MYYEENHNDYLFIARLPEHGDIVRFKPKSRRSVEFGYRAGFKIVVGREILKIQTERMVKILRQALAKLDK